MSTENKSMWQSDFAQYWLRIIGALACVKMATVFIKEAQELLTANMQARNPELNDEDIPTVGVYRDNGSAAPENWPDQDDVPVLATEEEGHDATED